MPLSLKILAIFFYQSLCERMELNFILKTKFLSTQTEVFLNRILSLGAVFRWGFVVFRGCLTEFVNSPQVIVRQGERGEKIGSKNF